MHTPRPIASTLPEAPKARLTRRDRDLLLALREHAALGFAPPVVRDRIEWKLAVAEILSPRENPDGYVQIGSIITCRFDEVSPGSLRMVLSERLVSGAEDVAVTSALGIAILGMCEGNLTDVPGEVGNVRVVTVTPPRPSGGDTTGLCT